MSIFDLHSTVLDDHRDFVRSLITIGEDRIRGFVDWALDGSIPRVAGKSWWRLLC